MRLRPGYSVGTFDGLKIYQVLSKALAAMTSTDTIQGHRATQNFSVLSVFSGQINQVKSEDLVLNFGNDIYTEHGATIISASSAFSADKYSPCPIQSCVWCYSVV